MIAVMDERRMLEADAEEVRRAIGTARDVQRTWARRPIRERAALIGSLRSLIAEHAAELAQATGAAQGRPISEKMVSEVLPLLEAARFLEKKSRQILRPKRFGIAGRPLWLWGSSFEVQRKPFGVILIVGPANYPLFVPAVQMLHALAAGNAVVIKPAAGASGPLTLLLDHVMRRSGIPFELVHLLPESVEAAREAVRFGVEKAIFTGSSENGRDFLGELAAQNTPSVMELSGADAVFVRADADVRLAARAIAFGLRLNAGNTCMAPQTIIVHQSVEAALAKAMRAVGVESGGVFPVRDDEEALAIAGLDKHGLGAAIFSRDRRSARAFADKLATGFVTINDIIVPTADPRFPFGGVRGSGFGVTRGGQGLLEMTYGQNVSIRRTRFLPHLDSPRDGDEVIFGALIGCLHGSGLAKKLRALLTLVRADRIRPK